MTMIYPRLLVGLRAGKITDRRDQEVRKFIEEMKKTYRPDRKGMMMDLVGALFGLLGAGYGRKDLRVFLSP
jgi:hypothetical protein